MTWLPLLRPTNRRVCWGGLSNAVETLLDEQGSQLHGLDPETVRIGVEAFQSATPEWHDAPLGPGRIRRPPAVCRDTQAVCKLRRELRGAEVSGAGLDLSSSLSAEPAGELVEVQPWLGHGNVLLSEVGKGEVSA
jgi:hypothetical protein